MGETVFVTGGTGFIAGWCIIQLLKEGYEVRTSLRKLAKEPALRAALAGAGADHSKLSCHVADLTKDDGWEEALAGCDYVMHVASPLGLDAPQKQDALTAPAREGTLRVLRAGVKAGVKRIVMTSAATVATPSLQLPDSVSDETVWFDPNEKNVTPYRHAKRVAERAAWDYMNSLPEGNKTTFTTVLPGAVFGPIISGDNLGSVEVIGRLLRGQAKGNARLGFEVVDVRDVADLHVRAMKSPAAAGERFLGTGEWMWMADISKLLRDELGDDAKKVPTFNVPDWVIRLMSGWDPILSSLTPSLSRAEKHTTKKARELLGWTTRPARDCCLDCARSLIKHKAV